MWFVAMIWLTTDIEWFRLRIHRAARATAELDILSINKDIVGHYFVFPVVILYTKKVVFFAKLVMARRLLVKSFNKQILVRQCLINTKQVYDQFFYKSEHIYYIHNN